MNIGVCTTDFETAPCDLMFKKIRDHGFVSTQFSFANISESEFTPDGQIEIPDRILPAAVKAVKEASKKYAVRVAACNGTFNIAHPDISVRSEGIRRFELFCGAVSELYCRKISLCSGTMNPDNLWKYHKDNGTKTAWENMIYTLKKIVPMAEKHGITLAVETEAANVIDTPEKARAMMDEIGSKNLKMVMDCANLFHAGKAKKENVEATIRHAFEVFGRDTVIAHGKDISESEGINFCPTGEGIIDYKLFYRLLREYNYTDDMMLHGIYEESKMKNGIKTIVDAQL